MKISDVMVAADYMICDGSDFLFKCWGDNTHIIDFSTDYGFSSVIFDKKTSEVYELTVSADIDGKPVAYRWLNPSYKDAYLEEEKLRGIDDSIAWDDVKWADTDTEEDILEKVRAILKNEDFCRKVVMTLDLDEETIKLCEDIAKRDGITIDDVIEMSLIYHIDIYEKLEEKPVHS